MNELDQQNKLKGTTCATTLFIRMMEVPVK